jgi:6-phosphogluconolactonase (cycloisomerase 2 family)
MKWNGTGRGLKALNVLGVSLAVGLGMTACSRDYTVAYLYATSATKTTSGTINAYAVDYQTGAIEQLPDSPIPSGGDDPVTLTASPNGKNIYVVNQISSTIVEFAVGTDGKLYGQNTYNVVQNSAQTIIGTNPTAVSVDPTGRFLFVTFTYQNGFTAARPGPGGFAVYPISATDGSLGTPISNTSLGGATTANPLPYFPVEGSPIGIFAASNTGGTSHYLYVVDADTPSSGSPYGVLLSYNYANLFSSSQSISQVTGGTFHTGFAAGTAPGGIAVDPTGSYIYVTDSATNQLYAFSAVSGVPTAVKSSPFPTGSDPLGVTVDPRGEYVYVANYGSNTVSSFAITVNTGALAGTASGAVSTDTGPTCVTVEPALGIYLFTSNKVDNSVSAEQITPETGALKPVQGTPFTAQALPTCAVAVANGAHATQIIQ